MANREIGQLPTMSEVDDEALFVAELSGKAYKVYGAALGGGGFVDDETMLELMVEGGLISPVTDGASIYTSGDTILIY